ncbi:L,D-transpeptidase-like protein [Saccharopolyspora erythraea NRRL 2338]|uniref:L,D-transpeptidase n=1 Tax=Saccharopolyspora erythraea TaxID=1836 RepID=UPI00031509BC|nr:L,D-transpeptidase [Saccharopolyspora erythraea]PFG93366.1 L,D-transpeptidase-like protein [Saccharopolyspora erythraea NRRL 2338]
MRSRGIRSPTIDFRRAATAVVGALVLTGCAGQPQLPGTPPPLVMVPDTIAAHELAALPESTTFGDLAAAPSDPAPQSETTGVVVRVKQDLAVYDAPHGRAFARLPATQLANPTWVPAIAEREGWAQVLLPSRPNGSTGWVWLGGPERTEKARSPYVVDVDVDKRRLVLRENGVETASWDVSVGAPASPTPRGRTFIMAAIEETVTRYSPIILPLGTHSETFSTYGGGPGTVALHGWPDASVFGQDRSDGCVRVPPDALRTLTSLPLGTLVLLR